MIIPANIQEAVEARGCEGCPRVLVWPMAGHAAAMIRFVQGADWLAFFQAFELKSRVPDVVALKYNRAVKLHVVAWLDPDLIKAGEQVALASLELALRDRYGGVLLRARPGKMGKHARDPRLAELLRHMVDGEGLTDADLPIAAKAPGITKRLTGETAPSLANIRNDAMHGYPFDGLPIAGLLELVRDLIDYAYRDAPH